MEFILHSEYWNQDMLFHLLKMGGKSSQELGIKRKKWVGELRVSLEIYYGEHEDKKRKLFNIQKMSRTKLEKRVRQVILLTEYGKNGKFGTRADNLSSSQKTAKENKKRMLRKQSKYEKRGNLFYSLKSVTL